MSRDKPCRWKCGRTTDRRCGICLECCNERDERNKRIDAGIEAYTLPEDRPNHRFYKRKQISPAKKSALDKATAASVARFPTKDEFKRVSIVIKARLAPYPSPNDSRPCTWLKRRHMSPSRLLRLFVAIWNYNHRRK